MGMMGEMEQLTLGRCLMSDRFIGVRLIQRLSVPMCVLHTETREISESTVWKVRGRKVRKDSAGCPLICESDNECVRFSRLACQANVQKRDLNWIPARLASRITN